MRKSRFNKRFTQVRNALPYIITPEMRTPRSLIGQFFGQTRTWNSLDNACMPPTQGCLLPPLDSTTIFGTNGTSLY